MEEAVFQQYAKAWRKRQKDEEVKRTKRLRQARETAENLAEMLVQNYGAKEVWLFGSPIRSDSFHRNSDIDLATSRRNPQAERGRLGVSQQMILPHAACHGKADTGSNRRFEPRRRRLTDNHGSIFVPSTCKNFASHSG